MERKIVAMERKIEWKIWLLSSKRRRKSTLNLNVNITVSGNALAILCLKAFSLKLAFLDPQTLPCWEGLPLSHIFYSRDSFLSLTTIIIKSLLFYCAENLNSQTLLQHRVGGQSLHIWKESLRHLYMRRTMRKCEISVFFFQHIVDPILKVSPLLSRVTNMIVTCSLLVCWDVKVTCRIVLCVLPQWTIEAKEIRIPEFLSLINPLILG